MFYIDDLLKNNNDCYILSITPKGKDEEIIGRAPIREDFVMNNTYTWVDQDNRNIMDLIFDQMRQEFKNAQQLQGHGKSAVGWLTGNDKLYRESYGDISRGKAPLDVSYMTKPVLRSTQSAYTIPQMTFIFVNKNDSKDHIKKAEEFLWKVTAAVIKPKDPTTSETKNKDGSTTITTTTEYGYSTPAPGYKPGYRYKENERAKAQSASGFTITKGNIKLTNLSLDNIQLEVSKETDLKGYPQAIKITLSYKDTQRRYPYHAIQIVRELEESSALHKDVSTKAVSSGRNY